MKLFDLNGRVAVITDGNAGIGLGIAKGLAAEDPRHAGVTPRPTQHNKAPQDCRFGSVIRSCIVGFVGNETGMPLSGKTVLVTGASAGIGRATVIALAQAGAKILATGRRLAQLDALKQQFGSAVEIIAGDLNDGPFVDELASAARDVDLFVNNAGVLKYAPLLDMTDADCEAMFRTNVLASFRITHRVAKSMVERRRGHIIVMTSIAAREVYRLGVMYCATKHALSAFARGLRIELQGHGIKVTEIAPGMVDTEIRADSIHPSVVAALAARKFEASAEVAEAVVYAAQAAPNCCPDFIELRPQGSA
jgi:3-hydroxy acid dehydrogenase / malonic semialdehyde reductase